MARGGVTRQQSGTGHGSDWMIGGYAAANFIAALNNRWSLNCGAQYQSVGTYSQVVGGKKAEIDLSNAIYVTVGLGYSF